MRPGPGLAPLVLGLFHFACVSHPRMAAFHQHQIDLTSPQPAEDGIEHATAPGPHTDALCSTCLGPAQETAQEPSFLWPVCQHAFHFTCVAKLRAHNPTPTCPACRRPWNPRSESQFQHLCAQHEILIPEPASHIRTAAAGPPPPPPGILPLCCNRVLFLDPAHAERDQAWPELPERYMHWAPFYHQTSQQCRPEWICLRCNTSVTSDHQLLQQVPEPPHCPHHGHRTLVLDMQRDGPAPMAPTSNPAPPPRCQHNQPPQQTQQNTTQHQPGPTNSWLYVPLLHAGAARLHLQAEQARAQDRRGGHGWQTLVHHLRAADSVPWQQLHNALLVIQQVSTHNGGQLSTFEAGLPRALAVEAGNLPPATRIHLLWAIARMTAATAATLADLWRRPGPAEPPAPDAPQHHTPLAPQTTNEASRSPPDTGSSSSSTSSASTSSSASPTPRGAQSVAPVAIGVDFPARTRLRSGIETTVLALPVPTSLLARENTPGVRSRHGRDSGSRVARGSSPSMETMDVVAQDAPAPPARHPHHVGFPNSKMGSGSNCCEKPNHKLRQPATAMQQPRNRATEHANWSTKAS